MPRDLGFQCSEKAERWAEVEVTGHGRKGKRNQKHPWIPVKILQQASDVVHSWNPKSLRGVGRKICFKASLRPPYLRKQIKFANRTVHDGNMVGDNYGSQYQVCYRGRKANRVKGATEKTKAALVLTNYSASNMLISLYCSL